MTKFKKALLLVMLMSVTIGVQAQNRGFTIKGEVRDVKEGALSLMFYNDNNKLDTLAVGQLKNGQFELTGKVQSIMATYLFLNQKFVAKIFLENKDFQASILADNDLQNKITGNKAQEIFNTFEQLGVEKVERDAEIGESTSKERRDAIMTDNQAVLDGIQAKYDQNDKWYADEVLNLFRKNGNSYTTAYLIAGQMKQIDLKLLQTYYGFLEGEAKKGSDAKDIEAFIKKMSVVGVGKLAPDFTVKTPEGQDISLYSIKGKLKLVDVWASWCGPCRAENPNVVKVYEKYKDKGLEIFSVSLDEKADAWIAAIAKDNLTWKHGSDLKGWESEVCRLYYIEGVPFTVLLDENNVIIAKNLRGEKLEQKISELLDK